MRSWVTASALMSVGLGWLIADRLLKARYPGSWGGPENIGGGALLLVAGLAVLVGFVLLVRAWQGQRIDMAGPGGDLVWSPARPGVAARVVSFTVIGLLAVGLGITVALTRGVSEEEGANGAVGVTVNVTGDAVLLLRVCTGRADTVTAVGPNRGGRPNESIATLTARTPVRSYAAVDVSQPPPGWTGTPVSLRKQASRQSLLIAEASSDAAGSELLPVHFTARDLASLDPC